MICCLYSYYLLKTQNQYLVFCDTISQGHGLFHLEGAQFVNAITANKHKIIFFIY